LGLALAAGEPCRDDALAAPDSATEPARTAIAIGKSMDLDKRGRDLVARGGPVPRREEGFMRTTFLGRHVAGI